MGRLAQEMAAGMWKRAFKRLGDKRRARLLTYTFEVSADVRRDIMLEFDRGRMCSWLTLEQKYSCWDVLPHYAAVLGHPDVEEAKQGATKCLEMKQHHVAMSPDKDPDDVLRDIHPLALRIFSDTSGLGSDVVAFASGNGPSADLEEIQGAFMFASVVEISIEAKHALGKHRVKCT